MPKAERGAVKSPNEEMFKDGGLAANGFMPLTRDASPVNPSNLSRFMHGDPGGSGSLTRQASPIPEPNRRFDVDNVNNGQIDNFPIQPGKGAVPVNPFLASGPGLSRALPIADEAKPRGPR